MNQVDQAAILRQLADEAALRQLNFLWCRGADRGDMAILRGLFHDDAVIDFGSLYNGPIDGFFAGNEDMAAQRIGFLAAMHIIMNMLFVIEGDQADGEIYSLALEEYGDPHPQLQAVGGRLLDHYERRDGIWRIASRRYVSDIKTHLPGMNDAITDPLKNVDLWGRAQDRSDPSYQLTLLAKLGAAG